MLRKEFFTLLNKAKRELLWPKNNVNCLFFFCPFRTNLIKNYFVFCTSIHKRFLFCMALCCALILPPSTKLGLVWICFSQKLESKWKGPSTKSNPDKEREKWKDTTLDKGDFTIVKILCSWVSPNSIMILLLTQCDHKGPREGTRSIESDLSSENCCLFSKENFVLFDAVTWLVQRMGSWYCVAIDFKIWASLANLNFVFTELESILDNDAILSTTINLNLFFKINDSNSEMNCTNKFELEILKWCILLKISLNSSSLRFSLNLCWQISIILLGENVFSFFFLFWIWRNENSKEFTCIYVANRSS